MSSGDKNGVGQKGVSTWLGDGLECQLDIHIQVSIMYG